MMKKFLLYCSGTLAVALCATAFAQSNGIGRVFFSPQERRSLETQAGNITPSASATQGSSTRSGSLKFNGMVQRSGGRSTAWVNGAPLDLLPSQKRRQYRLSGDRLLVNDSYGKSQLSPGEQRRAAVTPSKPAKKKQASESFQSEQ